MNSLYPDLIKLLIERYLDAIDSLTLLNTLEIFAPYKNTYADILSDYIKGWEYCIQNGKLDACKFIYRRTKNDICASDEYAFRQSCLNGHLNIALWLLNLGNKINSPINIHADDEYAFRGNCEGAHLDVVRWLVNLSNEMSSPINIHAANEYAFTRSCESGHLNIAQWLINLGNEISSPINIHVDGEFAFTWSCRGNHLNIAQ